MYEVIYLTGAPATGKSTLMSALDAHLAPLFKFSYSKELAAHISNRSLMGYSQDDMRRHSSSVITPRDVAAVDQQLIEIVGRKRDECHVIIDSHAVTKESFGFRVTPFRIEQLVAIAPTIIFSLYAPPESIIQRIQQDSQGRPEPTTYEAAFHNDLQASVAINYAIHIGKPVYFLDSRRTTEELVEEIVKRCVNK